MPREGNHVCAACEQTFGSKWALSEHGKSCAVRRDGELARIAETLAWKRERIERSVGLCYRYAARAFAAHHNARVDEARRFRDWCNDEAQQAVGELAELSRGMREASRLLFPRLERMGREVSTLLEQAQDLQAIGSVMNRLID